jgi:uncharacterized protein (DUF1697 family)
VTTYIALLRGINVGGNKKLPMADLRSVLAGLGHTDVRTLLQSGNAVFTSAQRKPEKIASDLERALDRELGLSIRILIRPAGYLREVVEKNPIRAEISDGRQLIVVFLSHPPDPDFLAQFDGDPFAPELFAAGPREMYFWCPNGQQDSPMLKAMAEKRKDVVATARNWNTVTKLLAMAEANA